MEARELEKALNKSENLVVSKKGCPFCDDARKILREWKIEFLDVDKTTNEELSKEISEKYGITTFPKIFLKKRFVGGASDLKKYVKGKEFLDAFGGLKNEE